MYKFKMNLQHFADPAIVSSADLEPAISIDFTSRITENINALQEILGIVNPEPMAAGNLIKIYKYNDVTLAEQVAEGEDINLTEVKRVLAKTIELTLNKYRKQTTAEAIQKSGREIAINGTDEKLVSAIRKAIKSDFFNVVASGTGTATAGTSLQAALANVWAAVQTKFADNDVTPIYFVSTNDVADYLGTASISTQSAFGFTYVEDFLGLGTVVVTPSIPAGTVYGTAKENLRMAYIPATGGDLAKSFNLSGDTTGLVGMVHTANSNNASVDTLLLSGVKFYPEFIDSVFKGEISQA